MIFLHVSASQDGVVDADDSTIRDFSASCIKEFLKWSIKQTSKKVCASRQTTLTRFYIRIFGSMLSLIYDGRYQRLSVDLHVSVIL